jgi:hypothetical protein
LIDNEEQYFLLQNKLISQPTSRQSQMATSTTTANMDTNPRNDTEDITTTTAETTDELPIKAKTNKNKLIIHYTHEKRFQSFKRDMHKLYKDIFANSPAMDVKMIVGNCNRPSARHELIRKRPNKSLLQDRPIKSKSYKKTIHILYFNLSTTYLLSCSIERQKKTHKPTTDNSHTVPHNIYIITYKLFHRSFIPQPQQIKTVTTLRQTFTFLFISQYYLI